MGVPGTEIQKAKGNKDSPELMAVDMMKAGLNMNYPDKVRALCEGAYPGLPRSRRRARRRILRHHPQA